MLNLARYDKPVTVTNDWAAQSLLLECNNRRQQAAPFLTSVVGDFAPV